jgi:hypothetical protein
MGFIDIRGRFEYIQFRVELLGVKFVTIMNKVNCF